MPHVFPHCMTAATAQLSVLVYTDAIMTLLNFVSSKRFSLLSHTDLEIQRGEAGISWVIFKNHLLEVCIIWYCKNKEGERLHYTLTGPYQNNFCFFVLFFFFSSLPFLQICLNWYNIERWIIQLLMLLSVLSQKLPLSQCWPSYKDMFSSNRIYVLRISFCLDLY